MAYIHQKPSGLWEAVVRTPAGRVPFTHELKSAVTKWAADLEADIRRGEYIDPRLARSTLGETWRRFEPSRRLEKASRARDASHWRVWVEPRWGHVPVGSILKPDVQA